MLVWLKISFLVAFICSISIAQGNKEWQTIHAATGSSNPFFPHLSHFQTFCSYTLALPWKKNALSKVRNMMKLFL